LLPSMSCLQTWTATGALAANSAASTRARHKLGARHDLVHQPPALGDASSDARAAEDHLLGPGHTDERRQPLGAGPAGHRRELDLRLAELDVLRRQSEVTGER
jgi:hypothetical protein